MFYTKEVKLYELQSVENDWGVVEEKRYVITKSIKADIQPYSQEKLNRTYGYDLQATKRMFCDIDLSITESTLVVFRGQPYFIVKIIEWDDYLDIALNDAVGVDLLD